MPFLNFAPALVSRRPGRVELTIPALVRGLYLVLGAALLLVLSRSLEPGSPLLWLFGFVIGLAALSEDRWIFDAEAGEMRRRYGLLLLAKSWALDLAELSSIEFDADPGDSSGNDPYQKVPGMVRKGFCCLRAQLADGKGITLCAVPGSRAAALRAHGAAIARATGKPFVEA